MPEGIRERDRHSFERACVTACSRHDYACAAADRGPRRDVRQYRAMDGTADELLVDPVGGYASRGKDVYWVTTKAGTPPISQIRLADAEAPLEMMKE